MATVVVVLGFFICLKNNKTFIKSNFCVSVYMFGEVGW